MHTEMPIGQIETSSARSFIGRALSFILIGIVLYAVLMVIAESRVRANGERNPFHQIAMMTAGPPDVVILGASHAMPLGFEGIGDMLEGGSGRSVMTLAIEGGGVLPNAVILDTFLRKTTPATVIYSLDTFAFLSPQWNEERITDTELFKFAPFDGAILSALLAEPHSWSVLAHWLSGFGKINDIFVSEPDRSEAEIRRFESTYRPNDRIDDQRVAYLFPDAPDAVLSANLARFEAIVSMAQSAGAGFKILLMPAPDRYTSRLPQSHDRVMAGVRDIAMRHGVEIVDHTGLLPEDENYYDTDHLNRTGATRYVTSILADLLAAE